MDGRPHNGVNLLIKNVCLFFAFLWPEYLSAAPAPTLNQLPPIIPLHQELTAVNYFREGQQTGCGLRATGEAEENVWLNVLISVFMKETGFTFGIFKVSAKRVMMKNGAPLIQNGRIIYSSIGKIHKAWLTTQSGEQPELYKNGEMQHIDGYMASIKFVSAMDLLAAIPRASFKVGLIQKEGDAGEIYEFDERIEPREANKLLTCMKNLRNTIDEYRNGKRS